MRITFQPATMKKRYPLRISRELITENYNLFVFVEDEGYIGIGEMAPGGGTGASMPEQGIEELQKFCSQGVLSSSLFEVWKQGREVLSPCVLAALDIALWDLHAKKLRVPLYKCLGLPSTLPPTSVTIGINPPEILRERVPEVLSRTGATILKVKLGSSEGIEADKASIQAIQESVQGKSNIRLRVDANGGWSLQHAKRMIEWLKERKVEFVEQPLPRGEEDALPELYKTRALPIFVDESCHFSQDVPKVANCVDGIVIKLMKCGGISEALRLVATARAFNLKTMIGCMGESSIAITAGASLGGVCDYLDLDAHLNLLPDPAQGVSMEQGILCLNNRPGHGAFLSSITQ